MSCVSLIITGPGLGQRLLATSQIFPVTHVRQEGSMSSFRFFQPYLQRVEFLEL